MSDEEKKAIEILNKWLCKTHSEFCKVGAVGIPNEEFFATEIVLSLIEKQSKEIEELKEDNKLLQENYSSAHEDINWFCENYISKEVSEQKERKAYIKGTNDADKLCNKKWEDKIKAKTIEIKNRQVKDEFITASQGKLNTIIDMESLLEKE